MNCERHGCTLIRKRVYQTVQHGPIGTPGPEFFMVRETLPHYVPKFYSETPDELHTEVVEVIICPACQLEHPQTLIQVRKRMKEREIELQTNVTGHFQLSALSEFTILKKVLPDLSDKPSTEIINRLRADGLRWHVGTVKRSLAERYQSEATKYGLVFIIG
jgi:hypothetical protein